LKDNKEEGKKRWMEWRQEVVWHLARQGSSVEQLWRYLSVNTCLAVTRNT